MQYLEQLNKYTEEEYQRMDLKKEEVAETLRNVSFTNNDVFRTVLASNDEVSKRILKNMIQLIVRKKVVDVQVENCEPVKENLFVKGVRLDVVAKCMDEEGIERIINIEIQNYGNSKYLSRRSQLYAAKLIVNQVQVGNKEYEYNEVYQVMFLNHVKFTKDDAFYHEYGVMEKRKKEEIEANAINIVMLELEKLKELDTRSISSWSELEKLCYMVKYAHVENKGDIIKMLEKESEVLKNMVDKKDNMLLHMTEDLGRLKAFIEKCDEKKKYKWAEEYGYENGEKAGIIKGEKTGFVKGEKQGRNLGRQEIITSMLNGGIDIHVIANCTGYTVSEIEKLRTEYRNM